MISQTVKLSFEVSDTATKVTISQLFRVKLHKVLAFLRATIDWL